jgi:hypothetical protein
MCRVSNDVPPHEVADEIAELLAAPPLGVGELFADPAVRSRVGQSISQSAKRPKRRGSSHLIASRSVRIRDR